MTKIAVDKSLIEQAIEALDDARHGCEEPHNTASAVASLRKALALAEPAVEPVAHATVMSLQPDECERKVFVKWVNQPVAGPLFTSPPPAEVPRLTDDEIAAALPWAGFDDIIESYSAQQLHAGLRAIEALVRKNAGLKCL